jgi:hypothetical protein
MANVFARDTPELAQHPDMVRAAAPGSLRRAQRARRTLAHAHCVRTRAGPVSGGDRCAGRRARGAARFPCAKGFSPARR